MVCHTCTEHLHLHLSIGLTCSRAMLLDIAMPNQTYPKAEHLQMVDVEGRMQQVYLAISRDELLIRNGKAMERLRHLRPRIIQDILRCGILNT